MESQEATARGEQMTDALLERLSVIEDQPIEQRAEAFARIHDELQRILEHHEELNPGG